MAQDRDESSGAVPAASIRNRLSDVHRRIQDAAIKVSRDPNSIRLIAVSKTLPAAAIREAYAAGQRDFGENRVQEGLQKRDECADLSITWHLLGHLQSNKARKAAQGFTAIQSVDSRELLSKLDAAAGETGRALELLIQVDLAGESTKSGVPPAQVPDLFEAAVACRTVQVVGLMTLPPAADVPEDARPWFRQLRILRGEWLAGGVPPRMLRELSMGMSGDFEVAVEEGATMVRVGSAIFGRRPVYQRAPAMP